MNPLLMLHLRANGKGGDTLLLEVALALREYRARPEELTWRAVDESGRVEIQLELPPENSGLLPRLQARLAEIPGVSEVRTGTAEKAGSATPPVHTN